jgi:hypothetical protein
MRRQLDKTTSLEGQGTRMFDFNPNARRRSWLLAVSLAALASAAPAFGQGADQTVSSKKADFRRPKVSDAAPTSPNATINLVNLLVKQGVLTQDQAAALIKQADDEAYVSRQAAKNASSKADEAAKAANAAAAAAEPPGTRHVTYVPEVVKRQLRDEIKKEVMAKAEKENWASPGKYPEWAERIHVYGDFRARYQGSFFPTGNDQFNAVNFNAINTGSPYDVSNQNRYFPPTYNVAQQRNQAKIRARLGVDADLSNGFAAGLRIATGDNSSPVSTNQTLGGGGGNFSKGALWLDRGFLSYQAWNQDLVASVGRFDNPFWSPTDLVWYRELGFDGVALQAKHRFSEDFAPFGVLGAFPLYNTAVDFGSNLADPTTGELTKTPSHDKWLYGGQIGFASRFDPVHQLRVAVAYYDFENVQGQLSSPCSVTQASDVCGTDLLRPSFAQKGNTYMALRNIIFDPTAGFVNQFQFFGLVSKYRPVVASASFDFADFQPYHIVIDSEFVWNSAFDRNLINNSAVVNNRAGTPDGSIGPFNGGDMGWMARVTIGNREIRRFGDWNAHIGYKYLESDATLDAFTDPDFGLGGTNLKGYFLGGNVGLSDNVWASLRWMSANNIGGTPYAVDVLMVDLNAKF